MQFLRLIKPFLNYQTSSPVSAMIISCILAIETPVNAQIQQGSERDFLSYFPSGNPSLELPDFPDTITYPIIYYPSDDIDRPLPDSLVEIILQQASVATGLPYSEIEIENTEFVVWPDSCIGIRSPQFACLQALTSGWRVIVTSSQYQMTYHTDMGSGVGLAEKSLLDISQEESKDLELVDGSILFPISEPELPSPDPQPTSEPSSILGLMILGGTSWWANGKLKRNKG